MLFKSSRSLLLVLVLLLSLISTVAMANCTSCPSSSSQQQRDTFESLTRIFNFLKILENANPNAQVEVSARTIQNILCEMKRLKLSVQGNECARRSQFYFEKTLANLGKQKTATSQQPCFATYPLATYFFGKIYTTEFNQPNPFKAVIWFHVERQMTFAKASIDKQSNSDASEKDKSIAYQKALNDIKIALKFIDAIDCISEIQAKQLKNSFQRCQFAYAQKDYASFDKSMGVLKNSLLRLKGILTADNC